MHNGFVPREYNFEATVGIEPTVRVLQTHALPLGDVALTACLPAIALGRRRGYLALKHIYNLSFVPQRRDPAFLK